MQVQKNQVEREKAKKQRQIDRVEEEKFPEQEEKEEVKILNLAKALDV
jgi:hypothetical protein